MPNLPTQYDTDEQDLERVKIATYVYSGFIALGAVFSAVGLIGTFFPYASLGSGIAFLLGAMGVFWAAMYCWANVRSAKAIAQRSDAHFSYFVSGMNLMVFPVGTLLSWYTWSVLSRPTVQELYKQGTPALPPTRKKKPEPIAVINPVPDVHWADTMSAADEAEEKLWQELERKAKAGDANGESKKESESSDSGGSIRLVPGDD